MNRPIVEAVGLGKRYESGPASTQVLTDVSFAVAGGESVAIVGVSGSGKSTLLHLLGGLDSPSKGSVSLPEPDTPTIATDSPLATANDTSVNTCVDAGPLS